MNTKQQQSIAASIRDQLLDVSLGLLTPAEWCKRFDEAEAAGVQMDPTTRFRRGAWRGIANAKEAGL